MIGPISTSPAPATEAARLLEAGAAFEALILQQMLAPILPTGNAAGSLATQALARMLAEASPFGVAGLLGARP